MTRIISHKKQSSVGAVTIGSVASYGYNGWKTSGILYTRDYDKNTLLLTGRYALGTYNQGSWRCSATAVFDDGRADKAFFSYSGNSESYASCGGYVKNYLTEDELSHLSGVQISAYAYITGYDSNGHSYGASSSGGGTISLSGTPVQWN